MSPETPQASQPDDEASVRALYAQLMDGWNRGSGEAFAAPFAGDGHLVAFDGMRFKGRDEIASFHQLDFVHFVMPALAPALQNGQSQRHFSTS